MLVVLVSSPCFAHHGRAPHYDETKPVHLEGVIASFDFINPHAFLHIDILDANGDKQTWSCEMPSRTVLARNGVKAESFTPGAPITIDGVAARHNATGCAFRVAYLADGSRLEDAALFAPTRASAAEIPADRQSIVGVWTIKDFRAPRSFGVATEAGKQASAAFDPIADDPAIRCEPGSPVRFWINVNEPFEIKREPDRVVINHRYLDSQRIVHLNGVVPADTPRTSMGYSTGRFEGNALVVTTDHFIAGAIEPRRAVLHTQNLKLTERLEVNAEGELEITFTIDDPEFFEGPSTFTEPFVRSRWDPEPFNCKPGYQQ
ncbi:MAG TPA: DUF6152 family protein [Gammaproteobacteria bacterium]